MRKPFTSSALLFILATLPALSPGDEPKKDARFLSGPQAGEDMPAPFHPYNVTGLAKNRDRFHCLACDYGLDPVVLVFVRSNVGPDSSNGLGFSADFGKVFQEKLVRGLNDVVAKNDRARLHAYLVLLSGELKDAVIDDDQRDKLKELLEGLAGDLKDSPNAPLCLESPNHLKDYKLNDQAEVTVILYRDHKVVSNFTYRKDELNDAAADKLLTAAVDKLVGANKP